MLLLFSSLSVSDTNRSIGSTRPTIGTALALCVRAKRWPISFGDVSRQFSIGKNMRRRTREKEKNSTRWKRRKEERVDERRKEKARC